MDSLKQQELHQIEVGTAMRHFADFVENFIWKTGPQDAMFT